MKPTRSLFLDCLPEDQPEGTYRRARNIVQEKNAKRNEPGMDMIRDLGFYVLHQQAVDGGNYVLFGTITEESSAGSRIGILDRSGAFNLVLKTDLLHFVPGSVFKAVYFRNFKSELVIAFTDNVNSPKIINLDALPFKVNADKEPLIPGNFILTEMFGQFLSPEISLTQYSDSGGQLLSGAYYFCFSYEFDDGSQTNKSPVTGPIMITDDTTSKGTDFYDGCEPGTLTSKSIQLTLNKLDTRYKFLRIYVVRKVSGVMTPEMVARKEIFSESLNFTYTGAEQADATTIESILINNPSVTTAKTLTILNKQLHLANVNEPSHIDYQSYANDIHIKWVKSDVALGSVRESFKDEVMIFNRRGFFPDEVYAFFIRFLMLDGSSSPAFHIPGRQAEQINYEGELIQENSLISDLITRSPALSFLSHDQKIDPNVKFFHTRETARQDGTMGFWENESEMYPNTDQWGSIKGEKVRHHKFPGVPCVTPAGLEATITYNLSIPFAQRIKTETSSSVISKTVFNLTSLDGTVGNSDLGEWSGIRYTAKIAHSLNIVGNASATLTASNQAQPAMNLSIGMLGTRSDGMDAFYTASGGGTEPRIGGYVGTIQKTYSVSRDIDTTIQLETGQWIEFTQYIQVSMVNYYYYQTSLNLTIKAAGIQSFSGLLVPVLGVSASNIFIPDQIKSKVAGFEILYAKRTFNNTRVLGQGAVFHYQKAHALVDPANPTQRELGPGIGSIAVPVMPVNPFDDFDNALSVLDDRTLRFHSFDMLMDRIAASPSYIKEQFCLRTTTKDVTGYADLVGNKPAYIDDNLVQTHFIADFTQSDIIQLPHYSQVRQLRAVNSFKYIPGDTVLSVDGTTLDNTWGEGHAYANIEQDGEPTNQPGATAYGWGTGGGIFNISQNKHSSGIPLDLMIGALYQYRADVYNNLFSQELVSTGHFYRLDDRFSYNVPFIFGGDTHVSTFGTRLTAPIATADVFDGARNKYKAVKAVYHFPLYSVHNASLRHAGVEPKDNYYPKTGVAFEDYKKWIRRPVDISNDNTFFYNKDYTSVNDLTRAFPYYTNDLYVTRFPYRIIRSNVYTTESKEFSMREFLALNYYEMPNTRGEITNIEAVGDILYINTRASIYRTMGNETMETSAGQVALGVGDIFRVPPKELITSENGYAGCQHMSSCYVSKLGYLFTDAEQGKIFLISGQLEEISNKGLRNYFIANLKPYVESLADRFGTAFDEDLNRLIVKIPSGDTLSYSADVGGWVSMHDYAPDYISSSRRDIVSIKGTKVYRHNALNKPGVFYDGITYPSVIDICFNPAPNETLLFASFNWKSACINNQGVLLPRDTFNKVAVYDNARCSGEIDIIWMQNIRNAEGEFRFNNFRDMIKNQSIPFITGSGTIISSNIDTNKEWMTQRRFVGSHVILRLIYNNISKNTIYLYSADVNYRLSAR